MTLRFLTLMLSCVLLIAAPARTAVIAYDSFNYNAGETIAGKTGGAGFTSAWAIRTTTGAGTVLTSTNGITVTPDHATNPSGGGGVYATRSLPLIDSGTVYFTFEVDNVNDNTRFLAFSPVYTTGSSTTGTELGYVGQASSTSVWNINSSGATISGLTYPAGVSRTSRPNVDPTLMVYKVEFDYDGSGQERVSLYLNPDLSAAEPNLADVVGYTNFTNGINALWAGSGFNNGTQTTVVSSFDNIVIATTWGELAVPEPGRAVLAFLGLILLTLRRTRY